MKTAAILALVATVFAFALMLTCALEGCKLHSPPPCTEYDSYPNPCAAAARDAGADG